MSNQILDLQGLAYFAQVIESAGFSPAARALGVPRQVVHRRVTALEGALDLRLLERTTRQVRPTDVGRRLYEHARRMLDEARAATAVMAASRAEPTGTLRITAPQLFGERFLQPAIIRFLQRWPRARIEAVFTLHAEDLLANNLDLAVRIGPLPDSSLIARRLVKAGRVACCAAPAYLDSNPTIGHPRDLQDHQTLHYGRYREPVRWRFERGSEQVEIALESRLVAGSATIVLDAARQGIGVVHLPSFLCIPALEAGELREVLEDWSAPTTPIHAVYPSHTAGNPTLRGFVDLLQEHLAEISWFT